MNKLIISFVFLVACIVLILIIYFRSSDAD